MDIPGKDDDYDDDDDGDDDDVTPGVGWTSLVKMMMMVMVMVMMKKMSHQEAGCRWETVLDVVDYEVAPWIETLAADGIMLKQDGPIEELGKAALRKSACLSLDDLHQGAVSLNLVSADNQYVRKTLLLKLAERFAPGDEEFRMRLLTRDDDREEDPVGLLAQDPLFDMCWEDMDEDDKRELGDVKKAINRRKCRADATYKRVQARKRKRAAEEKAGRKKRKGNAAPAAAPPDAPPAVVAPVVPPPAVVAPAPPGPGPAGLPGGYQYVAFAGGFLVFSTVLKKINAHCELGSHNDGHKCHMDRTCPEHPNFDAVKIRGRPIGLLALWLKKASVCEDKAEHHTKKALYAAPAYHAERARAREELWAMRHGLYGVEDMFSVEAAVPIALLGGVEPHLWEPAWSF